MAYELTKERFLQEVAAHEMTVSLDSGMHRHVTFKNPKTYNQHFHLTTWPGYLAYSGDMGSFVFARLPDMFQFFRGVETNPDYWAEKLQAHDRHRGHQEFSERLFKEAIVSDFKQWEFDSAGQKLAAFRGLREDLLEGVDDDLRAMLDRATRYRCSHTKQRFTDFWEHSLMQHTIRFMWCCYAIQWGIQKYDEAHPQPAAAA